MRRALAGTTEQLEALRDAQVVDAGAQGFEIAPKAALIQGQGADGFLSGRRRDAAEMQPYPQSQGEVKAMADQKKDNGFSKLSRHQ